MGKKNKSKSKKKNNNNKKAQNNKTTTTVVEPATSPQEEPIQAATSFIDSTISSSSNTSVKNDSAITTTDNFAEIEKATKENEDATKESIVTTTQTLNQIETVKNDLNKELNHHQNNNNNNNQLPITNTTNTNNDNNDINNQALSPKENPIIMGTILSVVASHHLDTQPIIEKVIKQRKKEVEEVINKDEKKDQPNFISPKENPIIMSTIHSVVASHPLDILSIVSTVINNNELINKNKKEFSTTKDENKVDDQNRIETNPIIKATIESVVASYSLDSLSIINKMNNNNNQYPQQTILPKAQVEKEEPKIMTASPTPSHTSSFKNSQHILNGSFHGKSGSPPHTETINATGEMLAMPEPALTSASLKGKGPLVNKRSSTLSISKQLPPTPVKGLPEIPSDEDTQQKAATSNEDNKPAPISKEKKKRSTLFFDKKKDKSKDKNKDKKSCLIQ